MGDVQVLRNCYDNLLDSSKLMNNVRITTVFGNVPEFTTKLTVPPLQVLTLTNKVRFGYLDLQLKAHDAAGL